MARRKNTKFIDPRYFMDEKMETLSEAVEQPNDDESLQEDADRKQKCIKLTNGLSKYHYDNCLKDPLYKPPKSKKRTLDDIPDIGVSRTGGPRPKGHPFSDYNPRDRD